MEMNPFEAVCCAAGQELPCLLRD